MEDSPTITADTDESQTQAARNSSITSANESAFPVSVDRRFEYLGDLGQGGAGKICLAYDDNLQRKVALKFLISADPGKTQMLLQEARAQAQLKHENICPIHEVNESQHQVYIVMQYIDGEPLHKISHRLNLDQKLLIVEKILLALQQAHSQGIVHRDIKPSNILVEMSDQGSIRPYLIDFGLAHRDSQPLAQSAGHGTPHYMAPEQASRDIEQIDRRADIYSVGATLYHLVTGRPPQQQSLSQANSIDDMGAYSSTPLDDFARHIPLDLQTLILKCLKVDPLERYSSARELADEIRLFLLGEPITAQRGLGYRLKKKIRKHRIPVMLMSLVLLTITFSSVWLIYQNYQQQIREQLIQRFSAKVDDMEARVRFAYMAPPHDLSLEIAGWRNEIIDIEQEMATLGDLAVGPGHYAIGRMHYTFQEYDKALEHLQLAWDSGFRQSRVAYILALTHGAIFQRQKDIANNLPSQTARQDRMLQLDKKYRQPAIQYLQQGMHASPQQSLARAMLFYYQGELDQALNVLQQTTDFPSWFYQDKVLTGDIYLSMSEAAQAIHKVDEVDKYLTLALENYRQASDIAPSDFLLQLKPVTGLLTRLRNFLYGKMGDFNDEYQQAYSHLTRARDNNPQSYQSYFLHGQLLSLKSKYENQYSGTPIETQDHAIEQLTEASRKASKSSDVWFALGMAYKIRMDLIQDRGLVLNNEFDKALQAFEQIDEVERDYFFYNTYGNLMWAQASYLVRQNLSASSTYFKKAIQAYDKAFTLQSDRIDAFVNAGSVHTEWSGYLPLEKAKEQLSLALEKYHKAAELNAEHFVVNYYLGECNRRMAQLEDLLFVDNADSIQRAKLYLDKAIRINPHHPYVVNGIALLESDEAVYRWQQGRQYQPLIKQAIARIDENLMDNPDNHILQSTRAAIYFNWWQLGFFSGQLSATLSNSTHKAIDQAVKLSNYNRVDKLLLLLLEGKKIDKQLIDGIKENDDRSLLFKAEWHSQTGKFELAESYFSRIQQIYPSQLFLYRRQHLLRWQKTIVDNEKLASWMSEELKKLRSKIRDHYPVLM